eukprot:7384251-Prymnesium_polylepis.2
MTARKRLTRMSPPKTTRKRKRRQTIQESALIACEEEIKSWEAQSIESVWPRECNPVSWRRAKHTSYMRSVQASSEMHCIKAMHTVPKESNDPAKGGFVGNSMH